MRSDQKVIGGSSSLEVQAGAQSFVVDVWGRGRKWAWLVTSPTFGAKRIGGGKTDTWAKAQRLAIRACDAAARACKA